VFAQMLSALEIYPNSEFLAYGLTEPEVRELRSRFSGWRTDLAQVADESP